ncbi:hypothetical protein [Nonomuraea sp. 10N515B]|uniref:hypothetical protein n=1 Tax=Nonomuraea sp. 10N515B TaxID=3457422 RepID=UPI003FCEC0B3
MKPIPGTVRRKRLLAIAAAVTVIGGGGYLAAQPALADLCDQEVEAFCIGGDFDSSLAEDTFAGTTEADESDMAMEDDTAIEDSADLDDEEESGDEADPGNLKDEPGDDVDTDSDGVDLGTAIGNVLEDYTPDQNPTAKVTAKPAPWGQMIKTMITRTETALKRKPPKGMESCDDLASGRKGRASVIFAQLVKDRLILNLTTTEDPRAPENPAANAEVELQNVKTGKVEKRDAIALLKPWISAKMAKERHRDSGVKLDDHGWRSLIVLHELGHLTGKIPDDHKGLSLWEPYVLSRCLANPPS